jgi:hypothetical protein
MRPWVESCGVLLLAAGGVCMGAWFSRLRKPWWALGYFIPLAMIVLYALGSHHPALSLVPPISWMMEGRNKFAVTGFIGAMILTTPLLKLPRRRDRIALSALIACLVFAKSVWPFLAPAFNRSELAALTTRIDDNGVCIQSTDYTCGRRSSAGPTVSVFVGYFGREARHNLFKVGEFFPNEPKVVRGRPTLGFGAQRRWRRGTCNAISWLSTM